NGARLRGVRFLADSARTHSLLMCTRCNWVRFVDGIHFFARERREEVRLLGFWIGFVTVPRAHMEGRGWPVRRAGAARRSRRRARARPRSSHTATRWSRAPSAPAGSPAPAAAATGLAGPRRSTRRRDRAQVARKRR